MEEEIIYSYCADDEENAASSPFESPGGLVVQGRSADLEQLLDQYLHTTPSRRFLTAATDRRDVLPSTMSSPMRIAGRSPRGGCDVMRW